MLEKLKQNPTFVQFNKYRPLIGELVKRDLKVKYRRSVLGYLWSLLNPLMMMCVMTIVFSYMFRNNIENFPLYLICGQTLWTFFNEATNMSMESILANGSLIKKVYIPKYIFPISRVMSSFVTMMFSLAAILIVMVFTRAQFHWTILLFWVPLTFLFLFCCGLGMALSALAVRFRDVRYLYSVLTLAWMYATPIFYPAESLPLKVQMLIRFNPMYRYIDFFRCVVIYGRLPNAATWFACVASCLVSVIAGCWVFRKMQRNFILYL
jgi:ABC-2 type transport system permease protein